MTGSELTLGTLLSTALATDLANQAAAPSIYDICISNPLYSVFLVQADIQIAKLRYHYLQIDAYCIDCERETPFYRNASKVGVPEETMSPGFFSVQLNCKRCAGIYSSMFFLADRALTKVGQWPSIEDITGADLTKYRSLLRDGYFEELTRANRLASHGIGIGSFVYLRRVFEKLIFDHRREYDQNNEPIAGFDGLRMDEKINALKDQLPPALVKNRATYGILSKGLHSLSEKECKLYFPVVREAIIQILKQDIEARERAAADKALEEEVQKIAIALKKPSS